MKKSRLALLLTLLLALGLLFAVPVFAEGETGEDAVQEENSLFTLNMSFNPKKETREWYLYETLSENCRKGYKDGSFYLQDEYKDIFIESPTTKLMQVSGTTLTEIKSTDYVDLTKSYRFIVSYPVVPGYVLNQGTVINVNGEPAVWEQEGDVIKLSLPVTLDAPQPLSMSCKSAFSIVAGDYDVAVGKSDSVSIASVTSSNTSVVKVKLSKYSYMSDEVKFTGLKPGKATITVKGANGAVGKFTVTVKSFLEVTSISVNALKYKTIGFNDSRLFGESYFTVSNYTISNGDKNVAVVKKDVNEGWFKITGKYPGTTTVTIKGPKGETSKLKVTVKPALKTNTKTPVVKYGGTKISSSTTPGAKVTAKIGTKTYKATADAKGKYTIKIPVVKIGTKITLKFTSGSSSLTKTITVKKCSSDIETTYWVYKNSTKVRGAAFNVHAGDYVKVTINGKTYKKTFTKNASSPSFSIPIKKPGKYGIKMKTELFNKFGQQMAVENEYVYLSDTVHTGDTKAKVKWLTSWNDPDKINYYTGSEQWCYDWDGDGWHDAYLYFRNGRVSSWQVFE